jgi:hypothetical protein
MSGQVSKFDLKRHVCLRRLIQPVVHTIFGQVCSIGASKMPVRAGDRPMWHRMTAVLYLGKGIVRMCPAENSHERAARRHPRCNPPQTPVDPPRPPACFRPAPARVKGMAQRHHGGVDVGGAGVHPDAGRRRRGVRLLLLVVFETLGQKGHGDTLGIGGTTADERERETNQQDQQQPASNT